jgi:cytochrome c biogenesis protein CcmG/thiol:disulfide interchange protein DsbE
VSRRYALPLAIFAATVALLAVGLRLDPRELPSALIGKPAPAFAVPSLAAPGGPVTPANFAGQVWILNVWASWCVSCREEHSALLALARTGVAPVVGLNYKDERETGLAWLKRYGDPYTVSAFDADGRIGMDYGVYGVPETFIIDKRGVVRYKRVGVLTPEVIEGRILPLVRKLQGA